MLFQKITTLFVKNLINKQIKNLSDMKTTLTLRNITKNYIVSKQSYTDEYSARMFYSRLRKNVEKTKQESQNNVYEILLENDKIVLKATI